MLLWSQPAPAMLNCPKCFRGIMRLFENKCSFLGEVKQQLVAIFDYGKLDSELFFKRSRRSVWSYAGMGRPQRDVRPAAVPWGCGKGWLTLSLHTQCICQLVGALARGDCRGIDVESQLEIITGILFNQVSSVGPEVSQACSSSFLWRRWLP